MDYLFDDEEVVIRGCINGLTGDMRATDIVEHLRAEGATAMAALDSEFYARATPRGWVSSSF